MAIRNVQKLQILGVITIIAFIGFYIFIYKQKSVHIENHTPSFVERLIYRKAKFTPQKMFPNASCPIGVELDEADYSQISQCIEGYDVLANKPINHEEMEYKRVMIHKPYLSRNDSLMIEVGGYTGADAARLKSRGIRPNYISLEPVPKFYKLLVKKFKHDKRFTILNFGLGRENKVLTIPIQTDATSLFRQNTITKGLKTTNITIRKSQTFFDEIGVKNKPVDLLHINCEGCEFELLEDLIMTGYIRYFNHIQFQFHMKLPYITQEACRYCQIMQLLTRTHVPMFQYRHTWQAWKKKDLKD